VRQRARFHLPFRGGRRTKSGGWDNHSTPARAAGSPTLPVAGREKKQCGACVHFRNEPEYLEAAFAGLASLSSAYGSVRAEDGLCLLHDRYLGAHCSCADFSARTAAGD
jgi:hypothetical protein